MRRALVTVLVAWGLIFARVVHAEPSLRLDVATSPGAEPCGGADELRARISEGLGRDPFTAPPDALARLRVALERQRRSWRAELTLFDDGGDRVGNRILDHDGSSCEPLVASVIFTATVLLEDLAPRPEPPLSSPPRPPSPPMDHALLPAPPAERRPESRARPTPRPRLDAYAGAAGLFGGAPGPSPGGEVLVGLDIARVRVELSGRAFLPTSSDGDVAVRAALIHGRLAPCYGWSVAAVCAAVALGSVSGEATGPGVADARTEKRLYLAAGLGALSRVFVVDDLVFVRASVDVLLALARAGFDVGAQRVWTVPPLSLAASLGLGVRLP